VQFKIELRAVAEGWEVRVRDSAGVVLSDPRTGAPPSRRLRRTAAHAFPLPPDDEAQAIAADQPHRELCIDADGQRLQEAYTLIVARQPGPDAVGTFGRYLFTTLLGDALWEQIKDRSRAEPLELTLAWGEVERALNRLPWEMMRTGEGFLAALPGVAITRRVAGTAAIEADSLTSPPRVLFVVGAKEIDDAIRPGAEYLGLLRNLRDAKLALSLKTHLLLQATTTRLEAAIKSFEPTVVHFICHGGYADGHGYLELVPERESDDPAVLHAENLIENLRAAGRLPQIVVLNACHTASVDPLSDLNLQEAGQFASPLAVELVQAGVPIVVGMAGEVADRACRLFTRRFYQAILRGEEIAQATAQGRLAGVIRHSGADPNSSVDWALPTLFLAEGVGTPYLKTDPCQLAIERTWHDAAARYATPGYPVFCDRLELVEKYDQLLAGGSARPATPGSPDIQVLAISVEQADLPDAPDRPRPRYGRTWLLQEMAAQAARNGHLPCLVTRDKPPSEDYIADLLDAIRAAAAQTAELFKLEWGWRYLPWLRRQADGAELPADFPTAIANRYGGRPRDPEVLAVAIRLDLLALLQAAREQRAWEGDRPKLLLLVDNVHRMDQAAEFLLNDVLGRSGLGAAMSDVRAVFTYAEHPIAGQENAINGIIKPWLDRTGWVESVTLREFRAGTEARLAYEYFLLHWRDENKPKPLAIVERAQNRPMVEWFLDNLARVVKGIPSNFTLAAPDHIQSALNLPPQFQILWEADDEQALTHVGALKRDGEV
jgi:hypothetical protein